MRLLAVEPISLGLGADDVRKVAPGEVFEAPDEFGAPLVRLGAAEVAPEPPAPEPPSPDPVKPEPVKPAKPPKG